MFNLGSQHTEFLFGLAASLDSPWSPLDAPWIGRRVFVETLLHSRRDPAGFKRASRMQQTSFLLACAKPENAALFTRITLELAIFDHRHGDWLWQTKARAVEAVNLLSVSPDQAKSLANSITKGGSAAFALAMQLASLIAEAQPDSGLERSSWSSTLHLPH